jgi:hypothetical protein
LRHVPYPSINEPLLMRKRTFGKADTDRPVVIEL